MKKLFIVAFLMLPFTLAFGEASKGTIFELSMATNMEGPTDTAGPTVRKGTTQFRIEGGFDQAPDGCSKVYAAVSGNDTHMISLLLMAEAQGLEISVHLNHLDNGKYYSDRCYVSYLSLD